MAQQIINIGTLPNDHTGDTLRDGGDKINDNFTELYGMPDTDGTLAANSDAKVATQKAVKTYIAAQVAGLLDLKGNTDCSVNPNYPSGSKGDAYYVTVAGKIGGASGKSVDIGDVYIASADNAGGTEASVGTSWFVLEHNLAAMLPLTGGTLSGALHVPDDAYDATTWNASTEVPTKNAVRDKIEALSGGSFTAASTTEQLTGTDSAKGSTPDSVAALWEQGADVASSGTISLDEGGYFHVTGTTTITDIDFTTDKAGRTAWIEFTGILTLTHNASTFILPTGANITTAAGDTACFVSEGSDVIRCVAYNRASGSALAGAVGGLTLLASYTASGSTASADFTSISGSYKDLVLVISGRNADVGFFGANVTILVNNLSTGIYDRQRHYGNQTTSAADASLGQTALTIAAVAGNSATAGASGSAELIFPSYANATFWKTILGRSLVPGDGSNNLYHFSYSMNARTTAAISRITVTSGTNFAADSTIYLYGRS